jgi:transposase
VIVLRSLALAQKQNEQLEKRLNAARAEIEKLTPPPGRGKRQFTDEVPWRAEIEKTLKRHQVEGLLEVACERQEEEITSYVGRGRGSSQRPKKTTTKLRSQITSLRRDEEAIAREKAEAGWRALVTNAASEQLPISVVSGQWSVVSGQSLSRSVAPWFASN